MRSPRGGRAECFVNSRWLALRVAAYCLSSPELRADGLTPAQRGKNALLGRHFTAPTMSIAAYKNVWKYWGTGAKEPPANYDRAYMEAFGLHPPPIPIAAIRWACARPSACSASRRWPPIA